MTARRPSKGNTWRSVGANVMSGPSGSSSTPDVLTDNSNVPLTDNTGANALTPQ